MRKAFAIGVNYTGTDHELKGCINDADNWASFFNRNGFDTHVLAEQQATRGAILASFNVLVGALKPGDVGAVSYSGHGTWLPDTNGDEEDGRDEALCPIDMGDDGHNLIVDDELAKIFANLAPNTRLIFITDSCHSGSVFRFAPAPGEHVVRRKPRFLPPSHFIKSPALFGKMEKAFGQTQPPRRTSAALPGVIHYSACKDNEYAADADIDGRACGAFSYYALKAFTAAAAAGKTYIDAWKDIRTHLPGWEYQQTPQFNCVQAYQKLPLLR